MQFMAGRLLYDNSLFSFVKGGKSMGCYSIIHSIIINGNHGLQQVAVQLMAYTTLPDLRNPLVICPI